MSNIKEVDFQGWVPVFPKNDEAAQKFYSMLGRMSRPSFGFSFEWRGERRIPGDNGGTKFDDLLTIWGMEAVHFEYLMELCWLLMEMGAEIQKCDARDHEDGGSWWSIKSHCKKYTRDTWKVKRDADLEEFMKKFKNRKVVITPALPPNK